ncbi:hypothetical protein L7F22_069063 [Adiantum nelumboides]|nr:hypothetical protein [Adiantum nelumboides]
MVSKGVGAGAGAVQGGEGIPMVRPNVEALSGFGDEERAAALATGDVNEVGQQAAAMPWRGKAGKPLAGMHQGGEVKRGWAASDNLRIERRSTRAARAREGRPREEALFRCGLHKAAQDGVDEAPGVLAGVLLQASEQSPLLCWPDAQHLPKVAHVGWPQRFSPLRAY